MNQRSIFMIKETNTGTWCVSAKHADFYHSFECASIFLSRENAEKAIKEMMIHQDPKRVGSPGWRCDGSRFVANLEAYNFYVDLQNKNYSVLVPQIKPVKFEVVEFEIKAK